MEPAWLPHTLNPLGLTIPPSLRQRADVRIQ
jgi:hypothetical protein